MSGPPQKAQRQPDAKPKILIVDDEPQIVRVLEHTLAGRGYDVLSATDGLEALNLARTHQPALIVLDLHLPKLDGHAICKMLKSDERYKAIPIVMLTASLEADDRDWASKAGADAFVNKPFDLEGMLATISALLVTKRSSSSS